MSDFTNDHDSKPTCTRCCASFILTLGLASLFMWLSLRTSNPILSIQDIYIPALNKTLNSTSYTQIYIDLKLDNVNKDKGVHYDQLYVTLQYYNSTSSGTKFGVTMSNYTINGFYQGHEKNTRRKLWVDTYNVTWDDVTLIEVDLKTAIRFKILFWNTKRHRLVLRGDFEVNDVGKKVSQKGTRLKSGAPEKFSAEVLLLVVFSSLFLVYF
ncbi:hypothetical protein Tco_1118283 [Tanacetum coccineum]